MPALWSPFAGRRSAPTGCPLHTFTHSSLASCVTPVPISSDDFLLAWSEMGHIYAFLVRSKPMSEQQAEREMTLYTLRPLPHQAFDPAMTMRFVSTALLLGGKIRLQIAAEEKEIVWRLIDRGAGYSPDFLCMLPRTLTAEGITGKGQNPTYRRLERRRSPVLQGRHRGSSPAGGRRSEPERAVVGGSSMSIDVATRRSETAPCV
jgi:hypothetical protein